MAMTAQVKAELASTPITKTCCRKAEVASMLRFAGGLHIVSGRIVVEAELDTGAAARRLRKDISEVYGAHSDVVMVQGNAEELRFELLFLRHVAEVELHRRLACPGEPAGRGFNGEPAAVRPEAGGLELKRRCFLARPEEQRRRPVGRFNSHHQTGHADIPPV